MATYRRLLYQGLSIGTIGLLLFGCAGVTPSPDQMNRSPFTGIPCAAPCWHDLVIGVSTESDVRTTLSTLTFINQDTIRSHQMSMPGLDFSTYAPGVEITANCRYPDQKCLTLDVVEDTLTEIEVIFNFEINLTEAIQHLGPPDYIGYRNLGGEKILCEVDMVWDDKQLVLASRILEGHDEVENICGTVRDTGKTLADLLLSRAWYRSPAAIETMLSIGANEFFVYSGTLPEK